MISLDSRGAWARLSRSTLTLSAALVAAGGAAPQAEPARDASSEGASADAWATRSTACGASTLTPAPVRERKVREGPVIARIAWAIDKDGSRYEIACFDMPEALGDADQAALLETIEYRLGNNAGVQITSRESARVGDLPAVDLRMRMPRDRRGRYWIFLQSGRRLFEVSVVGPPGERLTEGTEKFFGAFRLQQK